MPAERLPEGKPFIIERGTKINFGGTTYVMNTRDDVLSFYRGLFELRDSTPTKRRYMARVDVKENKGGNFAVYVTWPARK